MAPRALLDAEDRVESQRYLNTAKGRDITIGRSRKWNNEDIRLAYIAGRKDERGDPR